MKKAISIVFLLVQLSSSMKENVAHRELYYDGYDYVCHSGRPLRKDIILLVLDFDNRDQKTYFADGGTICSDISPHPWNQVHAASDWDYYTHSQNYTNVTHIKFNQTVKTQYTAFPRRTKSIIATSIINNPTIIEDEHYNCEIEGDGQVQHYGYYGHAEPCKFWINCQKIKISEIVHNQ